MLTLFWLSPRRFGRFGIAVLKEGRLRPFTYRCEYWDAVEFCGVRLYWWKTEGFV